MWLNQTRSYREGANSRSSPGEIDQRRHSTVRGRRLVSQRTRRDSVLVGGPSCTT